MKKQGKWEWGRPRGCGDREGSRGSSVYLTSCGCVGSLGGVSPGGPPESVDAGGLISKGARRLKGAKRIWGSERNVVDTRSPS